MANTRTISRVGLAAFGLIALATLISPLWEWPTTTADGAEIAAFVTEHRDAALASVVAYAFGMGGFAGFGIALAQRLREPYGALLVGGFAALTAVVLVGFSFMLVLAARVEDLEPATVKLLYDLCFGTLAVSGVPTAIAMSAAALSPELDRVSRALAAIAAVAHVAILASFFPETGFFSLEGGVIVAIPATMFVWLAYTSASLARASGERADR